MENFSSPSPGLLTVSVCGVFGAEPFALSGNEEQHKGAAKTAAPLLYGDKSCLLKFKQVFFQAVRKFFGITGRRDITVDAVFFEYSFHF